MLGGSHIEAQSAAGSSDGNYHKQTQWAVTTAAETASKTHLGPHWYTVSSSDP